MSTGQITVETFMSLYPSLTWLLLLIVSLITVKITHRDKSEADILKNKIDNTKPNKTFKVINRVTDVFASAIFDFGVVTLLGTVVIVVNRLFESYVQRIPTFVGNILDVTIGLNALTITLSLAVIIFDKHYYLYFSIREVLRRYKFSHFIKYEMISFFMMLIIGLTLFNQTIMTDFDELRLSLFEMAFTCNIIVVTYIFFVIYQIVFADENKDLIILIDLHKVFHKYPLFSGIQSDSRHWNKNSVKINLAYLLDRYCDLCQKTTDDCIEKIEFVTPVRIYRTKWSNKATYGLLGISICLGLFSEIFILMQREGGVRLMLINIGIIGISEILLVLPLGSVGEHVKVLLRYTHWCYYFQLKSGKEILLPQVLLRPQSKYDKLVRTANSIVALFYLQLTNHIDPEISISGLKEMAEKIKTEKGFSVCNTLLLFSSGYFFFIFFSGKDKKNLAGPYLRQEYKALQLTTEKQKSIFSQMIFSQVFNLTRYSEMKYEEHNMRCKEYIDWLQED